MKKKHQKKSFPSSSGRRDVKGERRTLINRVRRKQNDELSIRFKYTIMKRFLTQKKTLN